MMPRRRLCLVLAAVAVLSAMAGSRFERHTIPTADTTPLAGPAGIWQTGAEGAIFSIEPAPGTAATWNLTIVDSPDFTIAPGTHFGTITATGTPGQYEAALSADPHGRHSRRPKTHRFIFTLSDDATRLAIKPYKKTWRINLYRLIPYLFRMSVHEVDTRPTDIDGATRLSPPTIQPNTTL